MSNNYNSVTPVNIVLARLERVRPNGAGKWIALCPAHDDRNPSLAIKDDGDKVLLHCFAGCGNSDVLGAIGLDYKDLFADSLNPVAANDYKRKKLESIISDEKIVLMIARGSLDNGFELSQTDLDRVDLANKRIAKAKTVINGS
jgi:hypothetical protein